MKLLIQLIFLFSFLNISTSFAASPLVETNWLAANLDKKNIVLIDMSDETQYQRFHIKNAIQLPYHVLNKRLKNGVSLSIGSDNIQKLLGLLGITTNSHVIIYDDIGALHAGRLFWELERLNHKNVSILNGGLVKWILEGKPVTAKTFQPTKKTNYQPSNVSVKTSLATLDDVLPATRSKDTLLIDVRSTEEYIGNIKARRSGHIPGAKSWDWQNAVDFENQFKFKPTKVLKSELSKLGLNKKEQAVILYCQSAHRAAQSYITLRSLGFNNVKVYDGSMKEYSITPNAPLTKGANP